MLIIRQKKALENPIGNGLKPGSGKDLIESPLQSFAAISGAVLRRFWRFS
jgi:hypothetical protein